LFHLTSVRIREQHTRCSHQLALNKLNVGGEELFRRHEATEEAGCCILCILYCPLARSGHSAWSTVVKCMLQVPRGKRACGATRRIWIQLAPGLRGEDLTRFGSRLAESLDHTSALALVVRSLMRLTACSSCSTTFVALPRLDASRKLKRPSLELGR
jgi:hypothetical protein